MGRRKTRQIYNFNKTAYYFTKTVRLLRLGTGPNLWASFVHIVLFDDAVVLVAAVTSRGSCSRVAYNRFTLFKRLKENLDSASIQIESYRVSSIEQGTIGNPGRTSSLTEVSK